MSESEVTKKAKAAARSRKEVDTFAEFFRKHGIIGLAIGFVVGTQARVLVDQFSNSFINPILGLVVGTGEGLTGQTFYVTVGEKTATFDWGAFVFSLINFLIIIVIIYITFRVFRLDKLDKK